MPMRKNSFMRHMLDQLAGQGQRILSRAFRGEQAQPLQGADLISLVQALLSTRGEASGVAIAQEIMARYGASAQEDRTAFLLRLTHDFAVSDVALRAAYAAYDAAPSEETLYSLGLAAEPARQTVLRRLNLAPGNTLGLVRMREDLLAALPANPALKALDRDFTHLFASWFNRGFLSLKRIDWSSPATILEKIIRYEAVHSIRNWEDLRRRTDPPDRRCYAFFHPALGDEPLIFVEVALMQEMPSAIEPILTERRTLLDPKTASHAVFYSISNCQKGLAGISFGNFLIKQVVEELKREVETLSRFVTLSPIPGFRAFVEAERAKPDSRFLDTASRAMLDGLENDESDIEPDERVTFAINRMLAAYFLDARTPSGGVLDPVARFHLGNGARLERLNPFGDFSQKGWQDSYAAMVNYRYEPSHIEENHETFAIKRLVVASKAVMDMKTRALPTLPAKPRQRAS